MKYWEEFDCIKSIIPFVDVLYKVRNKTTEIFFGAKTLVQNTKKVLVL